MFRRLVPALLLAGLIQFAQPRADAQTLAKQSPNLLVPLIDAKSHTNYDALRQGTKMKVAVVPLPRPPANSAEHLPVFVQSASPLVPEAVSTWLELEPAEGFSLTAVKSPSSKRRRFQFSHEPVQVFAPAFKNHPLAFRWNVTAAQAVPVGMHVLRGKLTYRVVDDHGIFDPQVVPVEIPIRVVEHTAAAKKDKNWTFDQSQARETTTLVLLAPLMIPFGILNGIVSCLFNSCGS